ncbi:unnamed protein product [Pseudo-nitzschia multistriata]|uniref:Uncharacterized protein n=1 Tax=Pseudo-nitzschia multistriata TaxID=183589 RepID=A0A448Z4H0_9STRA|nr:unnamed protein product [Pseudo-nitzschia multistriata]
MIGMGGQLSLLLSVFKLNQTPEDVISSVPHEALPLTKYHVVDQRALHDVSLAILDGFTNVQPLLVV